MKTRSEHRQSELHRLAGPAPSRIRSQSRWQLTCLPRSQSGHHTLKLERVYFRINERNLLLGAILWSLLSLVFTPEEENSIKEGLNEFLGSGGGKGC